MRQFSLTEAKAKLSELLDIVESGEEVVIHRHGKAVARVVKEDETNLRAQRSAAWEALKQQRIGQSSGRHPDETLKDLINEGRRF